MVLSTSGWLFIYHPDTGIIKIGLYLLVRFLRIWIGLDKDLLELRRAYQVVIPTSKEKKTD